MNFQTPTQKKLSKAAVETLSIIVYHQPVTRSEIEEIRGVSFASGTLEILLNEIGMGDGFATKEFTIATTVTGANITVQDNVEVTIAEPTTTGH